MTIDDKGETVVEVLIGIAVVASVLAGAYTLLNRSYRQSQASVERIAALKAVESKVEILRNVSTDTLNSQANGVEFCLGAGGGVVTFQENDPNCKVDRYTVKIVKNDKTFYAMAEWEGLLQPIENLKIYYRP